MRLNPAPIVSRAPDKPVPPATVLRQPGPVRDAVSGKWRFAAVAGCVPIPAVPLQGHGEVHSLPNRTQETSPERPAALHTGQRCPGPRTWGAQRPASLRKPRRSLHAAAGRPLTQLLPAGRHNTLKKHPTLPSAGGREPAQAASPQGSERGPQVARHLRLHSVPSDTGWGERPHTHTA